MKPFEMIDLTPGEIAAMEMQERQHNADIRAQQRGPGTVDR